MTWRSIQYRLAWLTNGQPDHGPPSIYKKHVITSADFGNRNEGLGSHWVERSTDGGATWSRWDQL